MSIDYCTSRCPAPLRGGHAGPASPRALPPRWRQRCRPPPCHGGAWSLPEQAIYEVFILCLYVRVWTCMHACIRRLIALSIYSYIYIIIYIHARDRWRSSLHFTYVCSMRACTYMHIYLRLLNRSKHVERTDLRDRKVTRSLAQRLRVYACTRIHIYIYI